MNKGAAERVWKKLAPDAELVTAMLTALERQKPGWTEAKYIPHPATWLNNRRWEDEPESTTRETPSASERPFVF